MLGEDVSVEVLALGELEAAVWAGLEAAVHLRDVGSHLSERIDRPGNQMFKWELK